MKDARCPTWLNRGSHVPSLIDCGAGRSERSGRASNPFEFWNCVTNKAALTVVSIAALLAICACASMELSGAGIVGGGIVSTPEHEFASSLSADGATFYFNRTNADRSQIHVFRATRRRGDWSQVEQLTTGPYRDVDPFLDATGARLYVSSNRPRPGEREQARPDLDLWYFPIVQGALGDPIWLGGNLNTDDSEVFTSLTRNGILYFTRFDANRVPEIRRAPPQGESFLPSEIVAIPGSEALRLTNPAIAPDESYIMFAGTSGEPRSPPDLYISWRLSNGGWGAAEALGALTNSPFAEFAPHISPDERLLFFSSDRLAGNSDHSTPGNLEADIYSLPLAHVLGSLRSRRE